MTKKYVTMEQYHRKTNISREMLDWCMQWGLKHLAEEREKENVKSRPDLSNPKTGKETTNDT